MEDAADAVPKSDENGNTLRIFLKIPIDAKMEGMCLLNSTIQ